MSTENQQQKSFLEMDDEEATKLIFPTETPVVVEENKEIPPQDPVDENKNEEIVEKTTDNVDNAEKKDDESDNTDKLPESKVEDEAKEVKPAEEDTSKEEKPSETPKADTSTEVVNYEEIHKKIFKPLKANGKEIEIKDVDDVISLMQMGANYNKKMAALKPNLKVLKLLESNGLLDEDKLNFLIDLEKKSPEAITKLIKDSGIDVMDIDTEKAKDYRPKSYTVDDRQLDLDSVLDSIENTPTYTRTLNVLGKEWDAKSREAVVQDPNLITVINDQIALGVYDIVIKEVERERMFGRLNGLTDLQAYIKVGDSIHARGGFDSLIQENQAQQNKAPVKVEPVVTKPKVEESEELKNKRRAASGTKPAPSAGLPADFNPLSMPDEEFSKIKPNLL